MGEMCGLFERSYSVSLLGRNRPGGRWKEPQGGREKNATAGGVGEINVPVAVAVSGPYKRLSQGLVFLFLEESFEEISELRAHLEMRLASSKTIRH